MASKWHTAVILLSCGLTSHGKTSFPLSFTRCSGFLSLFQYPKTPFICLLITLSWVIKLCNCLAPGSKQNKKIFPQALTVNLRKWTALQRCQRRECSHPRGFKFEKEEKSSVPPPLPGRSREHNRNLSEGDESAPALTTRLPTQQHVRVRLSNKHLPHSFKYMLEKLPHKSSVEMRPKYRQMHEVNIYGNTSLSTCFCERQ